ncbi:hypothetical protein V9K67_23020 [Paraflavisolibacter sp. H34]|uniref:hypothetical protein n=1 Tax=Huijunlia imazamoxiresistens TaxID=3127457 RepID=UPI0030190E6C
MKKLLLLILSGSAVFSSARAQEAPVQSEVPTEVAKEEPPVKEKLFDANVSLHNQWYWRGSAIGLSPMVATTISMKTKSGFAVGSWNGFGLDGVFKDVDLFVSYSAGGFTLALWDIYNFTSPTSGAADPKTAPTNYFDYRSKTTRHFLDLSASYDFKKVPLSLFAATIIHGRDRGLTAADVPGTYTRSGENRYSTYLKGTYGFKPAEGVSVKPFVSYGFVLNNVDNTSFWGAKSSGVTEAGITVGKSIKITDTWQVGVTGGVVASPMNKSVNGLLGISLF